MKKTIIITGAAGFIGSNITHKLLDSGYKVIGIDNLSYGEMSNIKSFIKNKNFTFIKKDLRDFNVLKNIKGDVLLHLASQKIPRYTNAFKTLDENSVLLKNVTQKCTQDKIKLVFASTSDVYGKNPKIPYHEESDLVIGPTTIKRWAYAVSKIYSEQYIIAMHENVGLEYTIMRFFGSYGPNQNLTWWGGPQSVFIANAIKKIPMEIHGDGLQTRTFTYIEDTIQGIFKCLFHPKAKNEIFNIANKPDEEITILNLSKLIWKLVNGKNSKPLIQFIPYKSFGKYEDVRRRVPDILKIKRMLDYNPKFKLDEGLKKTIEWQKLLTTNRIQS